MIPVKATRCSCSLGAGTRAVTTKRSAVGQKQPLANQSPVVPLRAALLRASGRFRDRIWVAEIEFVSVGITDNQELVSPPYSCRQLRQPSLRVVKRAREGEVWNGATEFRQVTGLACGGHARALAGNLQGNR
jgi:hypothetical protein